MGLSRGKERRIVETELAEYEPWPPLVADEQEFYGSFAGWLAEVEHCDRVMPLGGHVFGERWGTPDVYGCISPAAGAIAPYGPTVIAGEVKTDSLAALDGFGQACSYKDFAHLSWLALPRGMRPARVARMERLCLRYQIGLALFDATSPADPRYELRVRPTAGTPDMAALNEKLALVKKELWG